MFFVDGSNYNILYFYRLGFKSVYFFININLSLVLIMFIWYKENYKKLIVLGKVSIVG